MEGYIILFCLIDVIIYFMSLIFNKKYQEKFLLKIGDNGKNFIFFVHILLMGLIAAEVYYLLYIW